VPLVLEQRRLVGVEGRVHVDQKNVPARGSALLDDTRDGTGALSDKSQSMSSAGPNVGVDTEPVNQKQELLTSAGVRGSRSLPNAIRDPEVIRLARTSCSWGRRCSRLQIRS